MLEFYLCDPACYTFCMRTLFAVLFFSITLAAQTEVEITAEPSHHLALQNKYVRVFQVEVAPHAATLVHRHRHDYVFVTLGASEISNEVVGKPAVTLKLQDGEVRAADGNFAHLARNLAATPFRNVTIELLQDEKARATPPPPWDDSRSLQVLHGGTQQILFVKDGVRVSETELQVAGSIPRHHHAHPHLVIAVTDLLLRNDEPGKPASNIEMKSGDIKWVEAGATHSITNVGKADAKFVTLEFQ
jgi:quercetin dioxygenase-like cupin family protein